MSRFLKVFLREPVGTGIQLAAFGKHPAWDDHLDDIGLNTESLALTKQLLYSEGIATQLASGAWDQLEKSGQAIEFDHRFVWSRDQQAIVGAIWASADRKRRTRFPLILCAQAGLDGSRASALLLDYVAQLGALCRIAKTQEELLSAFSRAQSELSRATLPSDVGNLFSEITDVEESFILQSLVTLSAGLKSKLPRGSLETVKPSGARFRLAAISSQTKDNLSFWSAYLATQCAGPHLPYLVIAANGRRWLDLIVGELRPNDLFCLRANENALPTSWAESKKHRLTGWSQKRKTTSELTSQDLPLLTHLAAPGGRAYLISNIAIQAFVHSSGAISLSDEGGFGHLVLQILRSDAEAIYHSPRSFPGGCSPARNDPQRSVPRSRDDFRHVRRLRKRFRYVIVPLCLIPREFDIMSEKIVW